jgi:hypothetical protein
VAQALTASAVGLFSSFQKDGVTNYAGDVANFIK